MAVTISGVTIVGKGMAVFVAVGNGISVGVGGGTVLLEAVLHPVMTEIITVRHTSGKKLCRFIANLLFAHGVKK